MLFESPVLALPILFPTPVYATEKDPNKAIPATRSFFHIQATILSIPKQPLSTRQKENST